MTSKVIDSRDFIFSHAENEQLKRLLLDIGPDPYRDYPSYREAISLATDSVPARFQEFCQDSGLRDFSEFPFVVIGNAPIDDQLPVFDPADPVGDKYLKKKTFVAEGFLAIYAVLT